MVTAYMIGTFRDVGWADLVRYCPGEVTAMVAAMKDVVEVKANVVYTRPDTIAQARYKSMVLCAILLGKCTLPSLLSGDNSGPLGSPLTSVTG